MISTSGGSECFSSNLERLHYEIGPPDVLSRLLRRVVVVRDDLIHRVFDLGELVDDGLIVNARLNPNVNGGRQGAMNVDVFGEELKRVADVRHKATLVRSN